MAYAHGITKEEVFDAASSIFANGKNPTQASVRSALGKGSYSTISKFLGEWRQQQTDAESLVTNTEEMPDQIRTLLNRTYAAIRAHAESSVMGERITVLEDENGRLWQENEVLKQDLVDLPGLRAAYHDLDARKEQVVRENERINKYLPQIEQVEELVAKINQLESSQLELLEENKQLDLIKSRLEDQVATSERNLATSIQRANEMQQQLAELTNANSKLNSQLTQIADRNQELIEQTENYQDVVAAKLAEIEELKNELKIAKPVKPRSTRKLKAVDSPSAS